MSRRVWLFDSFMGAPRPTLPEDEGDTHWTYGHIFAVSLDEVRANLAALNLDRRVLFRSGWFQETLPAEVDLERIAVLRLRRALQVDNSIARLSLSESKCGRLRFDR